MRINILMYVALLLLLLVIPVVVIARGMAGDESRMVFDHPGVAGGVAQAGDGGLTLRRFRVMESNSSSASGQFSGEEFVQLLQVIPSEPDGVWIVDLRQESHGFIDGIPISWYAAQNRGNAGRLRAEIAEHESKLLDAVTRGVEATVYTVKKLDAGDIEAEYPVQLLARRVMSEEQLVTGAGAHYKRFFVLDHTHPTDEEVDHFVVFVGKELPAKAWVHFHCRGGKGRSSTFMAMYYILQNAKEESFTEIMQRQLELGNIRLDVVPTGVAKSWKVGLSRDRYVFLQRFYEYARAEDGYGVQAWSAWSVAHR